MDTLIWIINYENIFQLWTNFEKILLIGSNWNKIHIWTSINYFDSLQKIPIKIYNDMILKMILKWF